MKIRLIFYVFLGITWAKNKKIFIFWEKYGIIKKYILFFGKNNRSDRLLKLKNRINIILIYMKGYFYGDF